MVFDPFTRGAPRERSPIGGPPVRVKPEKQQPVAQPAPPFQDALFCRTVADCNCQACDKQRARLEAARPVPPQAGALHLLSAEHMRAAREYAQYCAYVLGVSVEKAEALVLRGMTHILNERATSPAIAPKQPDLSPQWFPDPMLTAPYPDTTTAYPITTTAYPNTTTPYSSSTTPYPSTNNPWSWIACGVSTPDGSCDVARSMQWEKGVGGLVCTTDKPSPRATPTALNEQFQSYRKSFWRETE